MNKDGGTMSSAETDCIFDNGDTDSNGELSAIELMTLADALTNQDQWATSGCWVHSSGETPECGWLSTPCDEPPTKVNGEPDYTMCFTDSGICDGKRGRECRHCPSTNFLLASECV